jgi:hypothetical protein
MASHNPDTDDDELAPRFGKVRPDRLTLRTRVAIMTLAGALRDEPGLLRVQVTYDDLHGDLAGHDDPPTVHAILAPDGNGEYWLGENPL